MTSILFLTGGIYCNSFRYIDLRNEKLFLNFFKNFPNLDYILNIFKKKMILIPDVFFNLRTLKKVGR